MRLTISLDEALRSSHLDHQLVVRWRQPLDAAIIDPGAGDLAAQTRQAHANLCAVLAAVGASPADILRLRTYVVDHTPEKLGPVLGEIAQFYGEATPAPNTFIGVSALALPDFLIEIEATAAAGALGS